LNLADFRVIMDDLDAKAISRTKGQE
jgi:hypothetical protein